VKTTISMHRTPSQGRHQSIPFPSERPSGSRTHRYCFSTHFNKKPYSTHIAPRRSHQYNTLTPPVNPLCPEEIPQTPRNRPERRPITWLPPICPRHRTRSHRTGEDPYEHDGQKNRPEAFQAWQIRWRLPYPLVVTGSPGGVRNSDVSDCMVARCAGFSWTVKPGPLSRFRTCRFTDQRIKLFPYSEFARCMVS
jgi:hypothetical protein